MLLCERFVRRVLEDRGALTAAFPEERVILYMYDIAYII